MDDNTIRTGMKVHIGDSTLIGRADCVLSDGAWLVTDIGGVYGANGHFPADMLKPAFRVGQWARARSDAHQGIITGIVMADIWLRNPETGHRFSIPMADAELISTPAPNATPASTPDLERRVKDIEKRVFHAEERLFSYGLGRDIHSAEQKDALATINRRLAALEQTAPPTEPERLLEVGDKVWVKGKLTDFDADERPFRVDFGHGDNIWLNREITIKRA